MFAGSSSEWQVRTHGDRMFRPATYANAAASMSATAEEYFNRGSGDEIALEDNVTAWRAWAISPRVLVGVETVDLSVEVLGERWRHPLAIAPMARHNLATPEAERATVAAAAKTDTPCCISVGSSCDPRELATAAGSPLWFQMCLFRDEEVTQELAAMATDAGYRCLVITVDNPTVGLRNHFSVEVGRPDAVPSRRGRCRNSS
jgi:isopentenyl diphosphate isomerase/L-lactate dehydrogenase-like FMN-dependent dehydrogenase